RTCASERAVRSHARFGPDILAGMLRRPPRAGRRQRQGLVARGTRGANAENSAACYLLPTACATAVGDMRASAAGNCATSCVGTATNSTACDCTATIDTANIGGATTA